MHLRPYQFDREFNGNQHQPHTEFESSDIVSVISEFEERRLH